MLNLIFRKLTELQCELFVSLACNPVSSSRHLQQQTKELINAIKQLSGNFEEQHKSINKLEDKVEEQGKAIILHEEKIKRLEERR